MRQIYSPFIAEPRGNRIKPSPSGNVLEKVSAVLTDEVLTDEMLGCEVAFLR